MAGHLEIRRRRRADEPVHPLYRPRCSPRWSAEERNASAGTIGHPQIETEDIGLADIELESGALGTIEGPPARYLKPSLELAVFGEKGTVIIRNDYLTFYCFKDASLRSNLRLR